MRLTCELPSGFPADFIPVMLMCQRLPGYMGHWREAMRKSSPFLSFRIEGYLIVTTSLT